MLMKQCWAQTFLITHLSVSDPVSSPLFALLIDMEKLHLAEPEVWATNNTKLAEISAEHWLAKIICQVRNAKSWAERESGRPGTRTKNCRHITALQFQ